MARNYKKMEIYHLAYDFVLSVYKKTENFPDEEKQNITSQIRRASVSIPLNITEGSAKRSSREFLHFLNISFASAKEVEVLLNLSNDLVYFDKDDFDFLSFKLDKLNAKLFLFIRNVERRIAGRKSNFFQKFEG